MQGCGIANRRWLALGLYLLASNCSGRLGQPGAPARTQLVLPQLALQVTSFELVDSSRHRSIPVTVYAPAATGWRPPHLKLALLNHGYGGHATDYTFVARVLVAHGYLVASLQHELPGDAPMPTTGAIYPARYPFWERGVQTMLFARAALGRRYPCLDTRHLLLLGHSNGGDMAMLLAREHPGLARRIISLDNRRVPLPRSRQLRVLTLRSSDQVADPGVLPTPGEQQRFGITVVPLPATLHNDMWDGATEAQQQEMSTYIARFLESR